MELRNRGYWERHGIIKLPEDSGRKKSFVSLLILGGKYEQDCGIIKSLRVLGEARGCGRKNRILGVRRTSWSEQGFLGRR